MDDMNDIQKAIDKSRKPYIAIPSNQPLCVFSPAELKSLLEQVAGEQRESDDKFCDHHWIWIDKGRETILDNEIVTDNLTFNEE